MGEGKTTPGPWYVQNPDGWGGSPWIVHDVEGRPSELAITTGHCFAHGEDRWANAQLMAAAPDLYAALKMAAAYVAIEGSEEEHQQVEQALAKAMPNGIGRKHDRPGLWVNGTYIGRVDLNDPSIPRRAVYVGLYCRDGETRWLTDEEFAAKKEPTP